MRVLYLVMLVSVCGTASAREWQLRHQIHSDPQLRSFGGQFAVSLDENTAVASVKGGFDGIRPTAFIFDVETGQQVHKLDLPSNRAPDQTFISDGIVSIGGIAEQFLDFYDANSGERFKPVRAQGFDIERFWADHRFNGNIVVFNSDAEADDHVTHVVDLSSGNEVYHIDGGTYLDLYGDQFIIDLNDNSAVVILDTATGSEQQSIPIENGHYVGNLALSDTHAAVAIVDNDDFFDQILPIYDLRSGEAKLEIALPDRADINDIDIEGQFIVVSYDIEHSRRPREVELRATIFSLENGEAVFDFPIIERDQALSYGVSIHGNTVLAAAGAARFSDVVYPLHVAHLTDNIPGDYDNDSIITANDIDLLNLVIRDGGTTFFDLDGNGSVNGVDRTKWVVEIANTYFGDSNLDGEFNSGDLVAIFEAGEYEDEIEGNSTWATGDWNGDGEFNTSDLVSAFEQGGYRQGPRAGQAVPEPSTLLTLLAGLGTLAILRSSRSRERRER